MARRTAAPTAKAIAFFRRHISFLPIAMRKRDRLQTARALARAEAEASARGWRVEWEGDPDGFDETLGAILRDAHGGSLHQEWGVVDPSRDMKRVVEARLALEVLEGRVN